MFEEFDTRRRAKIVRDASGAVRILTHSDRYLATTAANPQDAAHDYLGRYGPLLGLQQRHLKNLTAALDHEPARVAMECRLISEKRQADLTTIAYSQTYFGLPIWEAGVSVAMKHDPLRILGARSTLHPPLRMERPAEKHVTQSRAFDHEHLASALGLAAARRHGAPFSINKQRLAVYRHDAARLAHATTTTAERAPKRPGGLASGAPRLPLPPAHRSIRDGKHYVVSAVYFSFDFPPARPLHWMALVEIETASVLMLRPFIDNVAAWVFHADPATLGGPGANAGDAALNRMRRRVTLDLGGPVGGTQSLSGSKVMVADVATPKVTPPTRPAGKPFKFNARSNDFAAVNAYYNCDRIFRLVEDLGFSLADYFPGTSFPSPVDHRGHYNKKFPQGNEINAHCAGTPDGRGIDHTVFALADLGNQKQPIGIACDFRVALHEILGHGVLYNHIGGPRFKFAHSAGDSFAAIINDPGSRARDRGATFPWLINVPQRRHDRKVAAKWGWNGDYALHPLDDDKDPGGYRTEQILSSTMFRFYRAIGGDAPDLASRRFAARMTCHVLLAAIHTLTPATSPPDATHFASALMKAELADWPEENVSGGAYHKVIRWAFEKQGLYQRPETPRPNNRIGAPPPVDVYIEDGRHGEYHFQSDYANCQAIWNRHRSDSGAVHQEPIAGVTNFAYVRIKNRGLRPATQVVVRAFQRRPSADDAFPGGWQPMQTAQLAAANVSPNSSAEIVAGPFKWVPADARNDGMLMVASAAGDPSNIDNFDAGDSIPGARLIPNDNNIALRKVRPIKRSGRRPRQ